LNYKFDYQYMLKSNNQEVLCDYYSFVVSNYNNNNSVEKYISNNQLVFNKFVEKADNEYLWIMMYRLMIEYRNNRENILVSKNMLENAQTCLNILIKSGQKPEYKVVQYEMDVVNNKVPDPLAFFETNNSKELQVYAEYFTGGYTEYYSPLTRWTNENQFAINYCETGLKLYEKLLVLNPADSIKRKASNVCFGLENSYILNKDYKKALEIAPRIQQLDAGNERGISGMTKAYLYNNQYNQAEQLVKKYKDKPSPQFGTYSSMIQADVEAINSYVPNEDCSKILTLLKK
jgi:hypothetical protein